MSNRDNVWELPFGRPAVLEATMEFGKLAILPVEPGGMPRVEVKGGWENVNVEIDRVGDVVRLSLGPNGSLGWFGNWECRASVYVPRDVRASVETSAGSLSVRDLDGCDLAVRTNAGKLDVVNVFGAMRLAADAGSITGRALGGAFDVETRAGSIRIEILDLRPGEHRLRATMGSVRVELARGMDVSVETHTSMGSVRNNYPMRAQAPARLVLSSEMGSVRVDEASVLAPAVAVPRPNAASRETSVGEDQELDRILKMVEAGELSAQDADDLLRAMGRV